MSELPPATLEGWYALHQVFAIDHAALRADGAAAEVAADAERLFTELAQGPDGSWSAAFRLAGGGADLFLAHFRPTLDELADVQARIRRSALGAYLELTYDFLSVTEAGMYHATAEAARETEPGSAEYVQRIEAEAEAERGSRHVRERLYPRPPAEMRYLSFYPMTKRRVPGQNWYTVPIAERSRMMREHGLSGRRYAGKVFQVITGSVGLDDWEWGVTLFARDPLEFKRIVTEMRYDEASAVYGEFGSFFTGIRFAPEEWPALLGAA